MAKIHFIRSNVRVALFYMKYKNLRKFEKIIGNIVHVIATFIKKWYNVIKSVNDLKDGK